MLRSVSIDVARAHGVPFVLWGSSALESINDDNYENYRQLGKGGKAAVRSSLNRYYSMFRSVLINSNRIERICREAYFHIGYHSIRYRLLSIMQRMKMGVPLRYALRPYSVLPFSESNPKFVHFFDYVAWDSIGNMKLLQDELQWKRPENKFFRFDCEVHCLANYGWSKTFKISCDGVNLCNFVREKKMTKEEALLAEQDIQNSLDEECKEVLKKVGLKDLLVE